MRTKSLLDRHLRIRLTPTEERELRAFAAARGSDRSKAVRELIAAGLSSHQQGSQA